MERVKGELERCRVALEDHDYVQRAFTELQLQASLLAQQNEQLKESLGVNDSAKDATLAAERDARAWRVQAEELAAAQATHLAKVQWW